MKLLLVLLLGCGQLPSDEEEETPTVTYVFNETSAETKTVEPKPIKPTEPVSTDNLTVEIDTTGLYFDAPSNTYWSVGPALQAYAGPYPCSLESDWYLPLAAELYEVGIRGLALWADNLGASVQGLVSDGYKSCAVRDCSEIETISIYCVYFGAYGAPQVDSDDYIYGSVDNLCDTADLAERESYCAN